MPAAGELIEMNRRVLCQTAESMRGNQPASANVNKGLCFKPVPVNVPWHVTCQIVFRVNTFNRFRYLPA